MFAIDQFFDTCLRLYHTFALQTAEEVVVNYSFPDGLPSRFGQFQDLRPVALEDRHQIAVFLAEQRLELGAEEFCQGRAGAAGRDRDLNVAATDNRRGDKV